MTSERERIAHVLRRLSMGTQPDLATRVTTVDEAVAAALDLSAPAAEVPALAPPTDEEVARDYTRLQAPMAWWYEQMASGRRLIHERLVWFWTDHFATGAQKVRSPDLMWRQHATIRAHATGSFADLLHAIAVDGAMLFYLDGFQNTVEQRNENYAREVMELHTLGRGSYTQEDVVAAARACTGWVVKLPFRPQTQRAAPAGVNDFDSFFVERRHDAGNKTMLGVSGALDLAGAIDVLLGRPETARFVAAKCYRALVGTEPTDAEVGRVAEALARDWSIVAMVEAIVAEPAFVSDAAVRSIVRTPVEKLVGLAQAVGTTAVDVGTASAVLRSLAYVPLAPPNPAGYPKGRALLGPHQLVHTFDLVDAVGGVVDADARDTLARFGCFDVGTETVAAIDAVADPKGRTLLALGSPEFALR